ncbi:uncharacterized protein J8A68_004553 [[Candida] subhashii]|uniref:Uncharacterized protein n=1 Tax=[Candida] subhashii TaxID=561895 RepID=A0A8J5QIS2_9ASCO|nr:uncharacterized protein J8A68_004553 [[Candida] subhashii]KAG7661950.1 hypothetical protein J8A68_004553 [[Candida] subhashii]
MFTRRKTRSTHSTAYTGVNHVAPASNQPNSGALAAALTIGNSMKQQHKPSTFTSIDNRPAKPTTPSSTTATPDSKPLSRSGSLFKRGSRTFKNPPTTNAPVAQQQPQANNNFRRFSSGSTATSSSIASPHTARSDNNHNHHPIIYDIDDTFNDTTEDSIYLNNRSNLQDLKLSHIPASSPSQKPRLSTKPPASRTTTSATSKGISSPVASGPVKMVKKYVPTPTGIKIIEVPESTYQKEVARCNSLRSGSRSNSLRSLTNKSAGPPAQNRSSSLHSGRTPPTSKRGSVIRASPTLSPLQPMTENVDLEDQLGKTDEIHEQEIKFQHLQHEIDKEKELARQIELKKMEYERLKKLRLENERKLHELEEEVIIHRTSSPISESTVTRSPVVDANKHGDEFVEVPEMNNKEEAEEIGQPQVIEEQKVEVNNKPEENEKEYTLKINKPTLEILQDDKDNEEKREYPVEPPRNIQELPNNSSSSQENFKTLDPGAELGIISDYGNLQSNELLIRRSSSVDKVQQPVPRRQSKISSIDSDVSEGHLHKQDSLIVPTMTQTNGSSRSSIYSDDSIKKPMKSAMKQSTSNHQLPHHRQQVKSNAAHQAYLSLATAENTRLNAKISASKMNAAAPPPTNGVAHAPVQKTPVTPLGVKRLSQQSLRKNVHPQAVRSLRPNSIQVDSHPGMSGRTLRSPTTTVQPIAPHPALQPNYQSPSKLRAQELYAKAQARPASVFKQSQQRKPPFAETTAPGAASGGTGTTTGGNKIKRSPSTTKSAKRLTLRGAPTATQNQGSRPFEGSDVSYQNSFSEYEQSKKTNKGKFKSRFEDSDSDDEYTHGGGGNTTNTSTGIFSRFRDSDEEIRVKSTPARKPPPPAQSSETNRVSDMHVLDVDVLPKKEKKKFGGKLKKLFGVK